MLGLPYRFIKRIGVGIKSKVDQYLLLKVYIGLFLFMFSNLPL